MNAAVSRSYNGWEPLFLEEFSKDYFKSMKAFLEKEYAQKTVYPPKRLILNAFDLTAPKDVKAVILGQDPYINPGQAMGLAFSVPAPVPPPPSLVNIFKEIEEETGRASVAEGGDLTCWARQGVLLLNTSLTVVKGLSNSHSNIGWQIFTDKVISWINESSENPVVFMLWGGNARRKKSLVTNPKHLVLEAAHPSPLSAYNGFFGCGHFVKANEFLSGFTNPVEW